MAINTLTFRQNMTAQLEKMLVQEAVTGFLEDSSLRAKFVGAKTVLIPHMDLQGLGDYDRDNGFTRGAITLSSASYELKMDRARSFLLDREDNDETGIANLAGQVMGEFVRTQVAPEVDAYVLSKIGKYAKDNGQTVTGSLQNAAYAMFLKALSEAREASAYRDDFVCFAAGSFLQALEMSSDITRSLTVSDFQKGDVRLQVKTLDGVKLIPVVSTRMKTAFTFNDGKTGGKEAGGFTADPDADDIGFILMPRRAASLVKKSETVRVFAPGVNQAADAYKFDYRLYYDCFLREPYQKAIRMYSTASEAA